MGINIKTSFLTFIFYNFYSSLQQLKDDIKAGRVPIHGVDIGGWLVAEHWMTSSSPAWNGVPDDIANQGEYRTMKYLGIVIVSLRFLFLYLMCTTRTR